VKARSIGMSQNVSSSRNLAAWSPGTLAGVLLAQGPVYAFPRTPLVTVAVTVTGTAGVKKSLLGLDSWIAAAEESSLQTASEGGKRRCRRDVLRQTVPNTGCSDWKGAVANS